MEIIDGNNTENKQNLNQKEVKMDRNAPSGIYRCTKCGNEETHVKGKPFAPCSKCDNNDWELVRETK